MGDIYLNRGQRQVLELLKADPAITFRGMAALLDVSVSTAFERVSVLRDLGLVDYGKCPTCGRGIIEVKGVTT